MFKEKFSWKLIFFLHQASGMVPVKVKDEVKAR